MSWNQNQFCSNFDKGSSTGRKSHKGLISKIQLNLNWSNLTQVYNTTWANNNYPNNLAAFYSQYIFNHITIKLFSSCTYHPVHIPFSAILSFYSFTQWEKLYYFHTFKFRNTSTHWLLICLLNQYWGMMTFSNCVFVKYHRIVSNFYQKVTVHKRQKSPS